MRLSNDEKLKRLKAISGGSHTIKIVCDNLLIRNIFTGEGVECDTYTVAKKWLEKDVKKNDLL